MVEARQLAGRYRVEERLATGGMGAVHAATDERLGRRVAIKLLKEELADNPTFVERFRREARAVAALSHPNIANVFDYGEDEGTHFIVMELVSGRDLARLIREEGAIEPDRVASICAHVCDALAHAHAAGVVHRDIKPANIIVGDDDRVKVTDFGIARAVHDVTLTATGSVLGTVHYISPEQASGDKIGPQADLYSLGIVLYEMLTGSLPFTGDSPVAVAMRHVSDEVPSPRELNPDVPSELDEAVRRATHKDPARRFASAAEMGQALRAVAQPDTAPLGAGVGGTAVLTADEITAETERRPFPLPERVDPYRLGRIVLLIFAVLTAVAIAFLIARLASDDEPRERARAPAAEPPAEESPSPTASGLVLCRACMGDNYKEVERVLKESGFEVTVVKQFSEDFEKDEVITTDPEPGSTVVPGQTITLFVSEGEEKDEEGDDGPPGRPEGKGPPKDKGKEEDD
ncbi:MAG: Stk1 family PASTA domain-containing Ser/Thr kinase [Actinomycetota bacterium]